MRIHIDVTALPESSSSGSWARYSCALRRESAAAGWACSVHQGDEGGPIVARSLLHVEPAHLLPAVREIVQRVRPDALLVLRPEAEPELKQRLALDCARARGWRVERCLGCMGSGVQLSAERASADGSCVLCAGRGMRYSRPGPRRAVGVPHTWSTDDVFAIALGAEVPGAGPDRSALAG